MLLARGWSPAIVRRHRPAGKDAQPSFSPRRRLRPRPNDQRRHPMARLQTTTLLVSSCVFGLSLAAPAAADDDRRLRAKLSGFNEDPKTVSTTASGNFRGEINRRGMTIDYTLSYEGFPPGSTVTQAHIHFGGRHQSGDITVFLCSNLGNGPAGTQACPAAPATISGTIRPENVIPTTQGIA